MLRLEYPIGILSFEELIDEWYKDASRDDLLIAARDDGSRGKAAIIISRSTRGDALISHFCLKHLPNPAIKLSGTSETAQ